MNYPIFSSTQGIAATAFLYIACVTCFLMSGLKEAMMQFFGVRFLKLKHQDT